MEVGVMKNSFVRFPIILLILLISLSGCATGRHRFYPGPARPQNEIAILAAEPKPSVYVHKIDGKNPPFDLDDRRIGFNSSMNGSLYVELLPGQHTLTISYSEYLGGFSSYTSVEDRQLEFNAKPGHVYKLSASRLGEQWFPVLKDVTGNPEELNALGIKDLVRPAEN